MTSMVTTVGRNENLKSADDVMRLGRIRHLPVLDDDGALAGIVSQRDLFHSGLLRALGYGSHARDKVLEHSLSKRLAAASTRVATQPTWLRASAGWDTTVPVLEELAESVRQRRARG
jgi:CBS-domain-containing membrane protein